METLKIHGDVPTLVTNAELLQILSKKCRKREEAAEQAAVQLQVEQDGTTTTAPGHPTATVNNSNNNSRRRDKFQHRDFIEDRTLQYLQQQTSCSNDLADLPTLVQQLKCDVNKGGYGLTDGETLQILNCMPKESVEIHLIIEDLSSRLSEDKREEVLELIAKYVFVPPPGVDEEEMIMGDEEAEEAAATNNSNEIITGASTNVVEMEL